MNLPTQSIAAGSAQQHVAGGYIARWAQTAVIYLLGMASLPLGVQETRPVVSAKGATVGHTTPAGPNILGSPAEPGSASVTALVEFTGNGATNKGSLPNGLIFASDGDIYGTAERDGANNYGTIFKMTTAGALTTLVEFAGKAPVNGSGVPTAPLVEGRDGNFYGTTSGGGVGPSGQNNLDNGSVFKLSRSGVLTTLVRFSGKGPANKGRDPYSRLVQAPTGEFYGTTFGGGSGKTVPIPGFRGFGTIYKMAAAEQLTTLYDFSARIAKGEGKSPWAGLTLGKDGNFYGSTWGGLGVAGTIFKLTPTGAMTTLIKFSGPKPPNKGGGCVAELVQASDGNFYGTTTVGGSGYRGTVFKMTPGGALTTLVEFANNDPKGGEPHAPLAEGNDGKLYGTTGDGGAYGWGTIFRVTPTGSLETLWNFNNPNDNGLCPRGITGALLKDQDGNFYGTTKWGGSHNFGTVFKLTLHDSGTQASAAPASTFSATATPAAAKPEQRQAVSSDQREFEAAKAEYEQASPRDEAARLTYVNKLAQIIDRNVTERWKTGHPNPDYLKIVDVIDAELKKHPAPKNSDPKKLSQLLIGQWQSPRHIYIFRRDGKYGVEDGAMDVNWRIEGNQIVMAPERLTILLLNSEYLIYQWKDGTVFFHSRVKQ